MSVKKIPNSERQIIQSNDGDYKGNIRSSWNIDLDTNTGVFKTSKRLDRVRRVGDGVTVTGDDFQAITIHDGQYYLIGTDQVYNCSVSSDPTNAANWSTTGTLGSEDLGLESDATSFKGLLLISLGTDIMSWDGTTKNDDWWTTVASGTALTTSVPHTMEVLRTGNDTLFIADGNKIRYYNTAAAGTIITLDTLMTAHCFAPALDVMWVGTYTEVEENAYVYEVRVGNDLASQAYPVDGRVVLTMFTYKNVPHVITDKGYVQAFDGAGFVTVAQFNWANDNIPMDGCRAGLVQTFGRSRAISSKGAKVTGNHAYILVDTTSESTSTEGIDPLSKSGIWVLDLETYSLTHRYSFPANTSDRGYGVLDASGPLLITNNPETRIMAIAQVDYTSGSDEGWGLWMENDLTPYGNFTLTRHESDSVIDSYESLYVKADKLGADDTIQVKYKDTIIPNFPLQVTDATWLNSNSFTTANALTNVEIGDEVEIYRDFKSGYTVHITDIQGSTTKTVVTDADFGVLNEVSKVSIDNWRLMEEEMTEDDLSFKKFGANIQGTFIDYKIMLNGDITIREVISKSNNKSEL